MALSSKRLSATVDIVNKLVVTAALVVGGIWALTKFVIADSPSAQLAAEQIKRACAERGSLDIKIEATSVQNVVHGTVILKNIGSRLVELQPDSAPISIAKLDLSKDGKLIASQFVTADFPYVLDDGELTSWADGNVISILPGRANDLHFVARVSGAGYYLISFRGGPRQTIPDDDVCRNVKVKELNVKQKKEPSGLWAASTIYYIGERSEVVPK